MSASSARTAPTTGSTRKISDAAMRPIHSAAAHTRALREIDRLMGAKPRTAAGDRLDILVTLVQAYEAERFPIAAPDPIEAIRFMMEQKGLTRRDLESTIGSRARVAEILNRRRPLTLNMIRDLSALLEIPADVLIQPYATGSAG